MLTLIEPAAFLYDGSSDHLVASVGFRGWRGYDGVRGGQGTCCAAHMHCALSASVVDPLDTLVVHVFQHAPLGLI